MRVLALSTEGNHGPEMTRLRGHGEAATESERFRVLVLQARADPLHTTAAALRPSPIC